MRAERKSSSEPRSPNWIQPSRTCTATRPGGESVANVRTDPFFDGLHWEARCLEGWTFRQDKSVRGFPYVFEAPGGYRLQVGTGRDVKINYGDGISCPGIASEPVRVAYVMTLQQAQMEGANTWPRYLWATARGMKRYRSKVRAHGSPCLAGFTYLTNRGWAGYFSAEPWMLYVRFTAPAGDTSDKSGEALRMIESIHLGRTTIQEARGS